MATHLSTISTVLPEDSTDSNDNKRPRGALLLAILSVRKLLYSIYGQSIDDLTDRLQAQRAFTFYRTGTLVIPSTSYAAQFSQENWGDKRDDRRTSKYLKSINSLSDEKWTQILDGAMEYAKKKNMPTTRPSTDTDLTSEDDGILFADNDDGDMSNSDDDSE